MSAFNTIFAYPNRFNSPGVAGGAWSVNSPLTYLQTKQFAQRAQAQNNQVDSTWMHLVSNTAETSSLFAFGGHNITDYSNATYRLRGGFSVDPRGAISLQFTGGVLDSRVTFSRASVAWSWGPAGVLVQSAVDAPRFEYDRTTLKCKGFLCEGSVTNLALWSRDLTQGGTWTQVTMSRTQTATGLDGVANSATRLTASGANSRISQNTTVGTGQRMFAVWLRRVTGTGSIQLTADNFVTVTTVGPLTADWQVYYIQTTGGAADNTGIQVVTNGDVIEADFAQVVAGGFSPFAPIATTTASVLKAEDIALVTMATYGLSMATGAMAGKGVLSTYPAGSGLSLMGLTDLGSNRITMSLNASGSAVLAAPEVVAAGVLQTAFSTTAMVVNDTIAFAMSWASNNVRASVNGGAIATDVSATMPTGATTVRFGRLSGAPYGGVIVEMARFFTTGVGITDADLVSLSGSELEMVAGYDSGDLPVWPAAWVAATTTEEKLGARYCPWHTFSYGSLYWRLDIDAVDNSEPVEIGRVFLGKTFQPAQNMDYGAGIKYLPRSLIKETYSGSEYRVARTPPRYTEFSLSGLSEAEAMMKVQEMYRQVLDTEEIFWAWNPTDTTYLPMRSWIARIESLSPLQIPDWNRWKAGYRLRELL